MVYLDRRSRKNGLTPDSAQTAVFNGTKWLNSVCFYQLAEMAWKHTFMKGKRGDSFTLFLSVFGVLTLARETVYSKHVFTMVLKILVFVSVILSETSTRSWKEKFRPCIRLTICVFGLLLLATKKVSFLTFAIVILGEVSLSKKRQMALNAILIISFVAYFLKLSGFTETFFSFLILALDRIWDSKLPNICYQTFFLLSCSPYLYPVYFSLWISMTRLPETVEKNSMILVPIKIISDSKSERAQAMICIVLLASYVISGGQAEVFFDFVAQLYFWLNVGFKAIGRVVDEKYAALTFGEAEKLRGNCSFFSFLLLCCLALLCFANQPIAFISFFFVIVLRNEDEYKNGLMLLSVTALYAIFFLVEFNVFDYLFASKWHFHKIARFHYKTAYFFKITHIDLVNSPLAIAAKSKTEILLTGCQFACVYFILKQDSSHGHSAKEFMV